ncbi:MAG: hypothetical protein ACK6DR_17605, partial [Gemmatimonas sp.]
MMHPLASRRLLALALLLSISDAATAGAQQAPAPTASVAVTRADLATRYLLMDAAYAAADSSARLADSTRAVLNRIFDRSTLSFFGGRFAVTAAMMDTAITMADPTY